MGEAELDINMDLDIDIEEEEEDDNGGFKIEMVDVGNLQAVVGTGTYSILGGDDDDDDEDEDGNNKGGEFDSRIITSLDWSSRQVPRNGNGNGHKEDVSMCNVSGFNINVPSTPASMSHASSKRTTGTTPRASLSKMRASLRGVNNNNNHPQGVRSGNRAQHSTIEEVDDEEHDGTTEPELDSEEDSEEEERQDNKVRENRRENSERREGSEEET